MALFGDGDDLARIQTEVDRLDVLSLEALAAEVFPYISGANLDIGSHGPTVSEVAEVMVATKLEGPAAISRYHSVAEGLQLHEQARLVSLRVWEGGGEFARNSSGSG